MERPGLGRAIERASQGARNMKARIVVVDDEAEIRRSVRMILEYEGYDVQEASSGPEALALVEREPPDLLFLDIKMGGLDGLETLQKIRQMNETLPVVIISGHGTVSTAVEATKLGAFDFIEKPLASERVLVTIRNALDKTRLVDENRTLKRAVEARHQMVGESVSLRQIWDAIKRAAPTNATVLLLGESGAGKELVARAIHRNSLRSRDRFIQVNCAAIPEELIESELFGHEKGSFTGATEKQIGKFEQADRGTIFLDEVGDMSAKTQAKVLRVLQEGEVERLGSARTIKVDVRVIAATNKDLEAEIERGTFREDLYFRLSVIPIRVPPLRDRREDIPALVRHFVDLFSRESSRRPQRFTPAALEFMQKARWKGNVRELRNTVERLLIMTPGDTIDVDDLRDVIRVETRPAAAPEAGNNHLAPGTLREFKESAERKFLVEKLRENAWNISKTAEVIGTPRSNLYKKLEQYAITQESDG
jgi:two-component system nitrogen regulation response regulator NtrX